MTMRRGRGEGAVYRVPADKKKPLQHWTASLELPPGPKGERRRKVIRRKNKAEVITELGKLRAELETRGDLPTASTTVEKWFTYWLDNIAAKKVRPNTLDGYKRTVENHIIPAIGKVKLDKVSPAHVRRVHDAIDAKGLSSTTALLAHRTMSTSFKMAIREGRIGRNPASLTDAPRKAASTLEALDLSEALTLLEHVLRDDNPEGNQWATSLLSASRRGEMLGLELDRVTDVLDLSWQLLRLSEDGIKNAPADYEYRHIEGGLYWARPKSKKGHRIIPLVDPLKSILKRHIELMEPNPWGLLFTKNGRPISPDQASRDWRSALRSAGIEKNVRLHDARHTTVDLLLLAGVPEDLISEIVGHSTRMQTREYKSLRNRQRLTAAMEQFSELFSGLPTSQRAPELDAPPSDKP